MDPALPIGGYQVWSGCSSVNNADTAENRVIRDMPLPLVLALGLVALAAIVLFARNLFVDNAVVFHDEYVYKLWSDPNFLPSDIIDRHLAQLMPNRLYFFVYSLAAGAGQNFYALAQWFNVAFWAAGIAALIPIAVRLDIAPGRIVLLVGAAVLLPMSMYTKYFMPEAMYFALFMLATWLVLGLRSGRARERLAAAGFVIGSMYYVKPHAIFLFGVVLAFLLCSKVKLRLVAALLLGVAAGFLVCKLSFPPQVDLPSASMGVYAEKIHEWAQHILNYDSGAKGLAKDVMHVAAGHLALFFAMFSLPLVVLCGTLRTRLGFVQASQHDVQALDFARYLLIATTVLIGVAVVFTVSAGEIGRLHSRYYFFLAPLWLLAMLMAERAKLARPGKIAVALLSTIAIAYLVIFGRRYSVTLPISVVSDGPEWAFLFVSRTVAGGTLVLLWLGMLWSLRTRADCRVWIFAIMVSSIASACYVTVQQKGVFRNDLSEGSEASAIEKVLGREAMEHALVVGRDRLEVSMFLFPLRSAPYMAYAPHGAHIDPLIQDKANLRWVILLWKDYPAPAGSQCIFVGERVRACSLSQARTL
ncbi:MAG TPA: hypothetical protein VIM98_19640 [Dyella sp.]|uniref:hypothetical protein n=1 Tax=Dyella sp. TaxID=1869338 RepID=UPI002F93C77F